MAANQPVSKSSEVSSCARVVIILAHMELLSSFSCPSLLAARQLIAKQAFLLAPLSSEQSMSPDNRNIYTIV